VSEIECPANWGGFVRRTAWEPISTPADAPLLPGDRWGTENFFRTTTEEGHRGHAGAQWLRLIGERRVSVLDLAPVDFRYQLEQGVHRRLRWTADRITFVRYQR